MIVCIQKMERVLAEQCMSATDLRQKGFSPATITRIRQGCNIGTKTIGRLAKALEVPLERLIEEVK